MNQRCTPTSAARRSRCKGSRRASSGTSTNVPPANQVEKISWTDTSKLSEAYWKVRPLGAGVETVFCQCTRLSMARRVITTPLGTPVEPEVWIT